MQSNYSDTKEFLDKLRIEVKKVPSLPAYSDKIKRYEHMLEECEEFLEANDLQGVVDSLIDIVYIALGTANMCGVDEETWNKCWARVHKANMAKEVNHNLSNKKLGVYKPKGWVAPDFADVLGAD